MEDFGDGADVGGAGVDGADGCHAGDDGAEESADLLAAGAGDVWWYGADSHELVVSVGVAEEDVERGEYCFCDGVVG